MRAVDLENKRVAIWGTGREGIAVAEFIRSFLPNKELIFIDETTPDSSNLAELFGAAKIVVDPTAIKETLSNIDVLVKSPGVSLNHRLVKFAGDSGVVVTSLLNLFLAESTDAKIICVTGTKGKSTTSTLIQLMLNGLGQRCKLFGNIGVPISITAGQNVDYLVLEVSSYQAADLDGYCDVALLTSLFPEHLDWHGSVNNYYESKINLLNRANFKIVSDQAMVLAMEAGLRDSKLVSVQLNQPKLFENLRELGNEYLSRPQNLSNVAMALEVIKHFNFDPQLALEAVKNFTGLPHRQRILGERDGIQYVDDSISTTPNSTIAALEVFKGRPLSLIAGGYDRGISYDLLVDYLKKHRVEAVVCLGDSGARIAGLLKDSDNQCVRTANSMEEAVKIAKTLTPVGGTVLLSPSAPSYGLFSNFIERGLAFAAAAGF